MPVSHEKWVLLRVRMETLHIKEDELEEKFILGSGHGGQKVNKTSSCVYIKHLPTGIEIKCQKERSREDNRYFARKELCSRVEEMQLGKKSSKQMQQEKIRKQKDRRARRSHQHPHPSSPPDTPLTPTN